MALTRIDIEARASAPKVQEVEVESLGGTVFMRLPSMAEWRRIHQSHIACNAAEEGIASIEAMAEAVGAVLSDSEGKRLFDRKEESGISEQFGYESFLELYELAWQKCLRRDHAEEAKKD